MPESLLDIEFTGWNTGVLCFQLENALRLSFCILSRCTHQLGCFAMTSVSTKLRPSEFTVFLPSCKWI